MNLYLVTAVGSHAWDTFDGFVVAARSHHDARTLAHERADCANGPGTRWQVRQIGQAKHTQPRGIVLASFNAG